MGFVSWLLSNQQWFVKALRSALKNGSVQWPRASILLKYQDEQQGCIDKALVYVGEGETPDELNQVGGLPVLKWFAKAALIAQARAQVPTKKTKATPARIDAVANFKNLAHKHSSLPQDTDSAIYKFFVAAQEESARCADDLFKQVVDERLETIVPINEMFTVDALDF